MDYCSRCDNKKSCDDSGIELPFIRTLVTASSVICKDTLHITHADDAKELGIEMDKALDFVEANKLNCLFFSANSI